MEAEKQFPYRISEWYLLRHELAREEAVNFLLQIRNSSRGNSGFLFSFFALTHLPLLVIMNFLENLYAS